MLNLLQSLDGGSQWQQILTISSAILSMGAAISGSSPAKVISNMHPGVVCAEFGAQGCCSILVLDVQQVWEYIDVDGLMDHGSGEAALYIFVP